MKSPVNIESLEGWLNKRRDVEKNKITSMFIKDNKRWFKVTYISTAPVGSSDVASDDLELALVYFKSPKDNSPRGYIYLTDIKSISDDEKCFTITSSSKVMILEASSRAEHRLWLQGLVDLCPQANTDQIKSKISLHSKLPSPIADDKDSKQSFEHKVTAMEIIRESISMHSDAKNNCDDVIVSDTYSHPNESSSSIMKDLRVEISQTSINETIPNKPQHVENVAPSLVTHVESSRNLKSSTNKTKKEVVKYEDELETLDISEANSINARKSRLQRYRIQDHSSDDSETEHHGMEFQTKIDKDDVTNLSLPKASEKIVVVPRKARDVFSHSTDNKDSASLRVSVEDIISRSTANRRTSTFDEDSDENEGSVDFKSELEKYENLIRNESKDSSSAFLSKKVDTEIASTGLSSQLPRKSAPSSNENQNRVVKSDVRSDWDNETDTTPKHSAAFISKKISPKNLYVNTIKADENWLEEDFDSY